MLYDRYDRRRIGDLSCRIVATYVAKNALPPSDLPRLIQSVHDALSELTERNRHSQSGHASMPSRTEIGSSIRDDGILSFIDGKIYKTLKRHLTAHGLDPQSYRQRFGLPIEYPMVAPDYARRRSAIARRIGLGQPGSLAEYTRRDRRAA